MGYLVLCYNALVLAFTPPKRYPADVLRGLHGVLRIYTYTAWCKWCIGWRRRRDVGVVQMKVQPNSTTLLFAFVILVRTLQ